MRRPLVWSLAGAAILAAVAPAGAQTTIFIPGNPAPPSHAARPYLSAADRADLALPALVIDGGPPVAAQGAVAKGEPLVRLGVRHGITGVLAAPVKARGWFAGGKKLPAGTVVYGVPMGGPDGPGLVWCAPRRDAGHGAAHWSAICLPFGDRAHVWTTASPALFPIALNWDDAGAREADPPQVTRGPADLPAMTLSYAFGGWDARGWLVVEERIDWGEGPQVLRSIALPRAADGAVSLRLLGGELAVRPDGGAHADQAVVSVRAPPRADGPIVL